MNSIHNDSMYKQLVNKVEVDRNTLASHLRSLETYCKLLYRKNLRAKGIGYGDLVEIKSTNSNKWSKCFVQEPRKLANDDVLDDLALKHYCPVFTKVKKDGTASKVSTGAVYCNVLHFFEAWEIRKVLDV